ncbi:DUF3788 domain-containing protein [Gemmatimonadota bacterium]
MALSALDDKARIPTESDLKAVLGPAMELWNGLRDALAGEYPPLTDKWGFSGKQWGWSLALKQKKRTILYLTPSETFFYAGFALGEKAVEVIRQSGLPPSVLSIIEDAPKYAEGRGLRLEIRSAEDVSHALVIAAAKMST